VVSKFSVRVSDAEAASDFGSLLARVSTGVEVIIEHDTTPVAVVRPAGAVPRTLRECIGLLASDSNATVDDEFPDDVTAAVASHPESLTPPTWD
jgi:antitoxin (DNA-binding transcriptional repressor) of toxin-antitoxin stability system